jgi:hypothetical protein
VNDEGKPIPNTLERNLEKGKGKSIKGRMRENQN